VTAVFLKRVLLALWALWLTVVLTTNVLDGLKALGLLAASWPFASGNYGFLSATTARYGPPAWLNAALFLGVIAWEGASAALFWLAWWTSRRPMDAGKGWRYAAFASALSLWLAFAIADEVFIAYPVEGTHLRLFMAQLLTLLAVELLPEARR
jgi:hypothetical protein